MALLTRKPTGITPWPIILLAGVDKAGKSWACAEASSSPLVHRTFWVGIGEDDPDEYANIPGADFEIVPHDGHYRAILDTLQAAVNEPGADGKPNLLVVDSMTRVWDMIKDDMEAILLARLKKNRKPIPDDLKLTMDLWNLAAQRWDHIIDTIRSHKGPVLLTSRLAYVTQMDDKGQPTKHKDWKVEAHKSLPYDVGGVIQMRARGNTWITGLRSTRFTVEEPQEYPNFTVQDLWSKLGVGSAPMGDRSHSDARAVGDQIPQEASQGRSENWWHEMLAKITSIEDLRAFYNKTAANPAVPGIPDTWVDLINQRGTEFPAAA